VLAHFSHNQDPLEILRRTGGRRARLSLPTSTTACTSTAPYRRSTPTATRSEKILWQGEPAGDVAPDERVLEQLRAYAWLHQGRYPGLARRR
jgi:hypothetical protein